MFSLFKDKVTPKAAAEAMLANVIFVMNNSPANPKFLANLTDKGVDMDRYKREEVCIVVFAGIVAAENCIKGAYKHLVKEIYLANVIELLVADDRFPPMRSRLEIRTEEYNNALTLVTLRNQDGESLRESFTILGKAFADYCTISRDDIRKSESYELLTQIGISLFGEFLNRMSRFLNSVRIEPPR